jgi:divalent metal cation (Fe/Co/Zn/Cd) transporter
MVAEGFHSVVDTGNNSSLLLGRRRNRRPAVAGHPLGHGKELYFKPIWNYTVPAFAAVFEGPRPLGMKGSHDAS